MAMSRADCLALLSLFVSARFSSCASVTDVRQPGGKGCGGRKGKRDGLRYQELNNFLLLLLHGDHEGRVPALVGQVELICALGLHLITTRRSAASDLQLN
jgi:hypothetical protein